MQHLQDERKSSKGMREAIAMANQAFHLELNVSLKFNNYVNFRIL